MPQTITSAPPEKPLAAWFLLMAITSVILWSFAAATSQLLQNDLAQLGVQPAQAAAGR